MSHLVKMFILPQKVVKGELNKFWPCKQIAGDGKGQNERVLKFLRYMSDTFCVGLIL